MQVWRHVYTYMPMLFECKCCAYHACTMGTSARTVRMFIAHTVRAGERRRMVDRWRRVGQRARPNSRNDAAANGRLQRRQPLERVGDVPPRQVLCESALCPPMPDRVHAAHQYAPRCRVSPGMSHQELAHLLKSRRETPSTGRTKLSIFL